MEYSATVRGVWPKTLKNELNKRRGFFPLSLEVSSAGQTHTSVPIRGHGSFRLAALTLAM